MDARSLTANSILKEDLETIVGSTLVDWSGFAGKTILVTGATGLIGGILVRALSLANAKKNFGMRIVGLSRHPVEIPGVEMFGQDVTNKLDFDGGVDYIVHGASPTASKFFVEHPVETIRTAVDGTVNMLEFAREKGVSKMVYLSSMEMYAELPSDDCRATEDRCGYLDTLALRSSYPQSKRLCETLCASYAAEYGVPVTIARLAQTIGAGIPATDTRVFVQFAKSVLNGVDIVLHTDGSKAHCCVYTTDAILGILLLLQKGEKGEAYNVSNEQTFASIREIAEMAVSCHPTHAIKLVFDIPSDPNKFGYPKPSKMLVDSAKLRTLGWGPRYDLREMFSRFCASIKD